MGRLAPRTCVVHARALNKHRGNDRAVADAFRSQEIVRPGCFNSRSWVWVSWDVPMKTIWIFVALSLVSCSGVRPQTCPDGEPINILKNIEDAYPVYEREYE